MTGLPGGLFSDPPVPASAPGAPGRPPFAEFDRGPLPEWALVRHAMDPAEVGDVPGCRAGGPRAGDRHGHARGSRLRGRRQPRHRPDRPGGPGRRRAPPGGRRVRLHRAGDGQPRRSDAGGPARGPGRLRHHAGVDGLRDPLDAWRRWSSARSAPGVPVFVDRQRLRGGRPDHPDQPRQAAHRFRRRDRERPDEDDRHRPRQAEGSRHAPSPGLRHVPRAHPGGRPHSRWRRAPIPFGLALVENGRARLLAHRGGARRTGWRSASASCS